VRREVNVYLKWAFVEAANSAILNHGGCGYVHLGRLYQGIKYLGDAHATNDETSRHPAERFRMTLNL